MKKVKLTESQYNKIKLLSEGQEVVHTFLKKAEDIKEVVNRMYSKLAYTTLAEIIDGEIDLSVMDHKLTQLSTVMYTHYKKGEMFFNSMPEDEFDNSVEWQELQRKLEFIYSDVSNSKIDALEELISDLRNVADNGIDDKFKDIKRMDL